jgi:hypothetical protein
MSTPLSSPAAPAGADRCQGRPPLCPRCHRELVLDPTGPWCRSCRTADVGAPRNPPCPMPPVATGTTPRTAGLRLCRAHARHLVDRAGPQAVRLDQPRT